MPADQLREEFRWTFQALDRSTKLVDVRQQQLQQVMKEKSDLEAKMKAVEGARPSFFPCPPSVPAHRTCVRFPVCACA